MKFRAIVEISEDTIMIHVNRKNYNQINLPEIVEDGKKVPNEWNVGFLKTEALFLNFRLTERKVK